MNQINTAKVNVDAAINNFQISFGGGSATNTNNIAQVMGQISSLLQNLVQAVTSSASSSASASSSSVESGSTQQTTGGNNQQVQQGGNAKDAIQQILQQIVQLLQQLVQLLGKGGDDMKGGTNLAMSSTQQAVDMTKDYSSASY